jgi:hypothetical protein
MIEDGNVVKRTSEQDNSSSFRASNFIHDSNSIQCVVSECNEYAIFLELSRRVVRLFLLLDGIGHCDFRASVSELVVMVTASS